MEIWFWAAVGSAVFAGFSNVYFKTAAAKGYVAEVFSFWGSVITLLLIGAVYVFIPEPLFGYDWVAFIVLAGGFVAAFTGIMKVYALRYIDTTIYFPLYKLVAPTLAIVFGVLWFGERFSTLEWAGMFMGLLIPLLLITKAGDHRQNNLFLGLVLVLVTGVFSAGSAALNKYGIDSGIPILVVFGYMSVGLFVGNLASIAYKGGLLNLYNKIKSDTSEGLLFAGGMRALLISISVGFSLFAYASGGTLAVVQTIHSMYILIPIVLAIIFYNEHWNLQKVAAIVLSVGALALLG